MITEDYVSFETAKLLKERGFDEYCKSVYRVGSVCSVASLGYRDNEGYGEVIDEKQNSDFGKYDNAISAPTLQMVMKWLREQYNIHIEIVFDKGYYPVCISTLTNKPIPYKPMHGKPFTYEEACEVAIKYIVENLI